MKSTGISEKKPQNLKMSPELAESQDFMPMSADDIKRLTDDIKINGVRHPIICYRKDGELQILAGWHRREIAVKLGINVPVDIVKATPKERKEFVIKENLARRHLNGDQKAALVSHLLKLNPKRSNKGIAKDTGTTKETVKKYRNKLEAGGEIRPVTETTGTDGKTYKKPPVNPKDTPKTPRHTAQEAPHSTPEKGTGKDIIPEEIIRQAIITAELFNLTDEQQFEIIGNIIELFLSSVRNTNRRKVIADILRRCNKYA